MKFNLTKALNWVKGVVDIARVTNRHAELTEKYGWCRGEGLFLAASLVALGVNDEEDLRAMCYDRAGLVDRRFGVVTIDEAARKLSLPVAARAARSSNWDWEGAREEGYPSGSPQEALHAAMAVLEDEDAYQLAEELLGHEVAERMVPLQVLPGHHIAQATLPPLMELMPAGLEVVREIRWRGGVFSLIIHRETGRKLIAFELGERAWLTTNGRQWSRLG